MKAGGAAMEKHEVERKLKGFLTRQTVEADCDWWRQVLAYMKTLSPSGVELEIMNLGSYDFSEEMQGDSNYFVSDPFLPKSNAIVQVNKFLEALLACVRSHSDADFV